jgi:HD domain-containing protein
MLVTSFSIVDEVLDQCRSELGHDFDAYHNHVYRVLNLCAALACGRDAELEKIATASVFHDLGIWTDHTFDYIAPSATLAREHLASHSRAEWIPDVDAMIVNHHKITRARSDSCSLVEAFRRADWIDVTRGIRRFGLARSFIASVFATWPSAGFHWRLVELAVDRFRHHPLTPLPMVKL